MIYYNLGDILYAFREEYLKVYKELEGLKKYIDSTKEYTLCLNKLNDNSKMDLSFVIDTKEPIKNSDRTSTTFGTLYEADNNKFNRFGYISVNNEDKIKEFLNKIEQTRFAKEFAMCDDNSYKDKENNNIVKNLIVWDNLFEMAAVDSYASTLIKGMYYRPNEDRVYFETDGFGKKITDDYIVDTLNDKVPEYLFRYYHKELFDKYPKDIDVILENTKKNNKCNRYNIESEGKKLILKRD